MKYISTELESGNAPQSAFGDYSWTSSMARAADNVARQAQIIKQKEERRQLVDFKLENRAKVDELKDMDLSATEFHEQYTSWFKESKGRFADEDLQKEVEANMYYGTIDSADYKRHVAELEGKAVNDLFDRVQEQYSNEWIKNGSVKISDLDSFHDTINTMEFDSKEQEVIYIKRAAEMEEIALLNADSMGEFDKMVDKLKYADKDPSRLNAIRKQVEGEFSRLDRAVSSRASEDVTDALSRMYNPATQMSEADMIDIDPYVEAGVDEETIRRIHEHNFGIQALKSKVAWKPEYFERLANTETMQEALKEAGLTQDQINYFMQDSTSINKFQDLAKYYSKLPPATRLQHNKAVQKALAEDNLYLAQETIFELMGSPDPEDKTADVRDYLFMDNTQILENMIAPDILSEYIERINPESNDVNSYLMERDKIDKQLGPKWVQAFDMAAAKALTQGVDNIADKNPKLAAYLNIAHFVIPEGQDIAYKAYKNMNGIGKIIAEQGIKKAEVEAAIQVGLFQSGQMGMYKDAMGAYGTDTYWSAFEDLLSDMVITEMGTGASMETALQNVTQAFNLKYYIMTPEGSQGPIFIPKDAGYIPATGFLDKVSDYGRGLFAGDKASDPYYHDIFQERKIMQSFDQMMENPQANMPYRALEPGAPPGGPYVIQDVGTFFGNALRQAKGLVIAGASRSDQRPFHIYDPERFHWQGAEDDNAQEMYKRTIDGSEFWFGRPKYRIEQAWGPRGEAGFRVYTFSKDLEGENIDPDVAKFDVPLIDRATGEPAFISYDEFLKKDTNEW